MTEPSLIARQRALLRDLIQRSAERARAEPAIAAALTEQVDNVEIEFTEGRESIRRRLVREQEENERQVEQGRIAIEARYKVEQDTAHREYALTSGQVLEREQSDKEAAQGTYQEACW